MVLPTTTVQGTLRDPDGTAIGGARLTFQLSHADADLGTNTAISAGTKAVITAANGTFSVDLWPNGNGAKNTHYEVEAFANQQRLNYGKIQVPETGPAELATLLRTAIVVSRDVSAEMATSVLRAETAAQEARNRADSVDMPALQAQVDAFTNTAKGSFPIAPNLMADTARFDQICGGLKGDEQDLIAAVAGPWAARRTVASATGRVTVVPYNDFAAAGIPTGGDLIEMEGAGDVKFCALLLDVILPAGGHSFILSQSNAGALANGFGDFPLQSSVFAAVLEATGTAAFAVGGNHAWVPVTNAELGQGWRHHGAVNTDGFAWSEINCSFSGEGRMKLAMVLPYVGLGDHGGAKIWAGSVGQYHVGDVV